MLPISQIAVLVVDDEVLIRMMLADELSDAGMIAFEAGDAAEALDLLNAHPEVSVLFTDINMPGEMNGLDLARAVQAQRPEMRLYLASGRERPHNDDLPATGIFIEKPYSAGRIAELIRQAA